MIAGAYHFLSEAKPTAGAITQGPCAVVEVSRSASTNPVLDLGRSLQLRHTLRYDDDRPNQTKYRLS